MKKLTFVLSILLSVTMFSCNGNEEVVNVLPKEKKENPQDYLKHLNETNPESQFGILHNKVVDKYMQTYNRDLTRSLSPEDSTAFCLSVRSQAIQDYLATDDTLMNNTEYGDFYDESFVTIDSYRGVENYLEMMPETPSKQLLKNCYKELEMVINDNDSSITSLLQRIAVIQSNIDGSQFCQQKNMMYALASVAANSLSYWEEYEANQKASLSATTVRFKSVAKTDYKVGKVAVKVGRNFGLWGWVGGAVVTGAASYLEYVGFFDKCRETISSWF